MTQVDFYDKGQIDAKEIGAPTDTASATGSLWARIKNALTRIGSLETADSNNVKKTGTSTVTGTLEVPTTPPTPTSAVNSVYVNDATEGVNNIVHKASTERITGTKTIANNLTLEYPNKYNVTPSTTETRSYFINDTDGVQIGQFGITTSTTGRREMWMFLARNINGNSATLRLRYEPNNTLSLVMTKNVGGTSTETVIATL